MRTEGVVVEAECAGFYVHGVLMEPQPPPLMEHGHREVRVRFAGTLLPPRRRTVLVVGRRRRVTTRAGGGVVTHSWDAPWLVLGPTGRSSGGDNFQVVLAFDSDPRLEDAARGLSVRPNGYGLISVCLGEGTDIWGSVWKGAPYVMRDYHTATRIREAST